MRAGLSEHQGIDRRRDIDSLLNWGTSPSSSPDTSPREIHQPDIGAPEPPIPAGASEPLHVDTYGTSAFGETTKAPDSAISDPGRQSESYVSQLQVVDPSGSEKLQGDPVSSLPSTDETAKIEINPESPSASEPDNSEPGEIEGSQPSAAADSDAPDGEIYPEDPDGDVTEDPNPPDAPPDTPTPEGAEEAENPGDQPEDPDSAESPVEIIAPDDPADDPKDQTGQPEDPETPAPETPGTPDPNAPETPAPENPETPDPNAPDPNAPETPDPNAPETPDPNVPGVPDTPGPDNGAMPEIPVPPQEVPPQEGGASSDPKDIGQEGMGMPSPPGSPSGGGGTDPSAMGGSLSPSKEELEKAAKEKAAQEARAKADQEKAAKALAAAEREQSFSAGGVDKDWRNADLPEMEKLGNGIKAVADGEADKAHTTAKGIDLGFPGFGLLGLAGLTGAHDSTRDNAARYIEAAKTQLTSWNDQVKQGITVIKSVEEKNTIKEAK
jgi:hypothetical protein